MRGDGRAGHLEATVGQLDTSGAERARIGRRTLIKRAAATGAVAWTAPLIVDSLTSPAAAITCTSDCFRVTFPADDFGTCGSPSAGVEGPCTAIVGPGCTATENLPPLTQYFNVCISPATQCQPSTATVVFNLNATDAECFQAGTCPPPRRFVAAQAFSRSSTTSSCVNGVIDATGTSVTFTLPFGQSWVHFTFVISCTCT